MPVLNKDPFTNFFDRIYGNIYFLIFLFIFVFFCFTDLVLSVPQMEEVWGDAVTRAVLRNRLEDRIRTPYAEALVLPPSLLDQLTQDVLTIAKDEPCGIR